MSEHILHAGAGRAVVDIERPDILPVEGFTAVCGPMHARALVLDSNVRAVIVSLEITQIPDSIRLEIQDKVCAICQAQPEHIWITTTHSFAGPHLFPAGGPGGGRPRSPEEVERGERLKESYVAAVEQACRQAMAALQPAVAGCAAGLSAAAAGRSIQTAEGWWLGTDSEQPCDRTVSLLRVDSLEGKPLAALFVYGVRSTVMHRMTGEDGGALVSSDLCGGACEFMENVMGGDFTALFLCGAACDQEPVYKGVSNEVDKDGKLYEVNLGTRAAALLEAQSVRLGSDVLKVWRSVEQLGDVPEVRTARTGVVCATKVSGNTKDLKPVKHLVFEPNGEQELQVSAMAIGSFALAGMQPEMGGVTSTEIRQAFPDRVAAMAIMVNGNGKCMPHEEAYRLFQYQSQNTPFMPGQAEKLRDAAIDLLKGLQG